MLSGKRPSIQEMVKFLGKLLPAPACCAAFASSPECSHMPVAADIASRSEQVCRGLVGGAHLRLRAHVGRFRAWWLVAPGGNKVVGYVIAATTKPSQTWVIITGLSSGMRCVHAAVLRSSRTCH